MKKKSTRRRENEEISFISILIKSIIHIPIFCMISLLCILLIGLIFYSMDDPTGKIDIAGYISLYLSVFINAFILSRRIGQKHMIIGLLHGAVIFLLTIFVAFFFDGSDGDLNNLALRSVIIIVSVLASLLARRKRKNKMIKRKSPL